LLIKFAIISADQVWIGIFKPKVYHQKPSDRAIVLARLNQFQSINQ